MKTVYVLGTGCARCNRLHEVVSQACHDSANPCRVEKVTDFMRFPDFGVMVTPALVIDGVIRASGRVPSTAEVTQWLAEP